MSELLARDLAVGYGKTPLISEICLRVRSGEIVAVVGPNGAGKTTLLKTVAGLLEPQGGAVFLDSQDFKTVRPSERARRIAVMTTARAAAEFATCRDVVSVGRYQFTGVMGRLSAADRDAVDEALQTVGAQELSDAEFDKLSDGQKQRVLLARALAQEPGVLILDEPTGFLDVGYKLEFIATLKRLARDKKIGVLMTTHEIELARAAADSAVCVSADRRIDRVGPARGVLTNDYVETLFNIPRGEFGRTYGEYAPSRGSEPARSAFSASNSNRPGAKFVMIQGTMSNVGKSLIAAGLCRIFKQDGYRVAPFKSQNMALNSYVTADGLEMGRAQVMQAEAVGTAPSVLMNPILLKPTDDCGSQVIVNGKVVGNMRAKEYFAYKTKLLPEIRAAVDKLAAENDIIVIEGAGSPAEINLKANDIVNMGIAKLVDAPVLLVGDVDRGGVFAQLLGTLELLDPDERARVTGLIVNKFRGDKSILDPGLAELERRSGIPVVGVVPYAELNLDDEDSLSERFARASSAAVNVGVVKLDHIANFTDFDVFEQIPGAAVRYVKRPSELAGLDLLILPGTKNTIADMRRLAETGLESAILKYASAGGAVVGICGGYQILGEEISDPSGAESGGRARGLGLLPVATEITPEKRRRQVEGTFVESTGILAALRGAAWSGYEIHMGLTRPTDPALPEWTSEKSGYCRGNIYGTYVHGLFDRKEVVSRVVAALAERKGIELTLDGVADYAAIKEREYDRLAQILRESLDMAAVYKTIGANR